MDAEDFFKVARIEIAILLILVGGKGCLLGVRGNLKATECVSWPSTDGIVTNLNVGRGPSIRNGNSSANYNKVKIKYDYEVDGMNYSSDRFSFLSPHIKSYWKDSIKEEYAIGNTVKVYYNPNKTSEAVILTGINRYNKRPFFVPSVITLGFGIISAIAYVIKRCRGNYKASGSLFFQ